MTTAEFLRAYAGRSLDIASAYFNIGAYRDLGEHLNQVGSFCLPALLRPIKDQLVRDGL